MLPKKQQSKLAEEFYIYFSGIFGFWCKHLKLHFLKIFIKEIF